MPSKIEWTDETWNPITGCTKVSEGCKNCYAERMTRRLAGRYGYPADDPFRVTVHPNRMAEPLHWRKPRRVFVCSMGDLFHEDVNSAFVELMCEMIYKRKQHTFLILTKRPKRMLDFFGQSIEAWGENIWMGVTAENQQCADERIPILLDIPAAVRFVSAEPLLGPLDISKYLDIANADDIDGLDYGDFGPWRDGINWVICGGESGPGARPMHPDWAGSLRNQCKTTGVPFFFKQWGEWAPVRGYDPANRKRHFCFDGPSKATPHLKEYNGLSSANMYRYGKKKSGRLLYGSEYGEMPNLGG